MVEKWEQVLWPWYSQDLWDSQDLRNSWYPPGTLASLEPPDVQDPRDFWDLRDLQNSWDPPVSQVLVDSRNPPGLQDLRTLGKLPFEIQNLNTKYFEENWNINKGSSEII